MSPDLPTRQLFEPKFSLRLLLGVVSQTAVSDNYNLKSHKYVCITTYQPDTKSNSNPIPNPNLTTKKHAIVNIQLNIVTCPTY